MRRRRGYPGFQPRPAPFPPARELVHSRLRRPGVTAEATQPMHTFDLMPKERVLISSTSLLQLTGVERLPRAKNEI